MPRVHRVCAEHASRPSRGVQSRACTIALLGGQGLRVRTREVCRRLPGRRARAPPGSRFMPAWTELSVEGGWLSAPPKAGRGRDSASSKDGISPLGVGAESQLSLQEFPPWLFRFGCSEDFMNQDK